MSSLWLLTSEINEFLYLFNTLRPKPIGLYFSDKILKMHSLKRNFLYLNQNAAEGCSWWCICEKMHHWFRYSGNGLALNLYPSLNWCIKTLRLRQNGRRFTDDTFQCIFLNENVKISIKISLKFVPKGQINNIPALVQIMAWRRPGGKPLSKTMMIRLETHICVTRPQWVNIHESVTFPRSHQNHNIFLQTN